MAGQTGKALMKIQRYTRAALAAALTVIALGSLSACASETQASVPQESDVLSMQLPNDVSAEGVVLAAVLLSTSDIELALAEGLVTPAEVDLAQAAVDDGTLQQWQQRAERELAAN